MKRLLIGLMAATAAAGQTLSWGIKAGVGLNALLKAEGGYRAGMQRYTLGPALELSLPLGWKAEFGALYKRFDHAGPTETAPLKANPMKSTRQQMGRACNFQCANCQRFTGSPHRCSAVVRHGGRSRQFRPPCKPFCVRRRASGCGG